MITIKNIPLGTVSAQTYLVEIDESLCKAFNVSGGAQPIASVTFQSGAVKVLNGFAVVPIIATVVLNTPSGCACGGCNTHAFVERVDLAFVATDDNSVALTPGTTVVAEATSQKCGKARSVKVTTTLKVEIA